MSTIITRNSATSGSVPSSLTQGELAINVTNGRLFYGSGSGNIVKEFTGSASGTTVDTGSFVTTSSFNTYTGSNTSQFAGTASFATNALTASYVTLAQTASYVLNAVSASFVTTASYALTASYATNGGVTQIIAGPNITVSPTTGVGQVTISSTGGGGGTGNTATGSYGSFYDTTIQTNVASTARSMSLNTTDISNGVSISGSTNPYNTYIKVENAGVYDIQFSAQVDKTDSGTDEIWIWLRKNGINVTDSATSVQLQGNGAHYVAAWNFFVNAAANDYFQLMWYSPDANVRLHAEAGFGVVPGIPSLIVTANRVDQFLSNTGSFSGSFTGNLIGTSSWASNSITASYIQTAQTASYVSSNFQYEIHVSQIDGNDTTGDGSLLKPVATVTKALTLLGASRKTIIIHPGTYSENVTVADTNTTISTSELTGANTLLSGTLTIGTLGSGTRISGLKMSSLVISGTAQAYISNCTVDNQVTKSSSGYVEIINSELQCISGIQISGAGTTIINGNKNVAVSVSNASAQVIIKGCNSVVTPSASAGNLAIVDCIITALGGNGITITGASTTLTLLNSQVLVTEGNNVAPISVAGIYSIINTIYDKPGSSLTGISTNSIDYFQYIDADNVNTKGLSVTGSITVSGSVINNLTASYAISASQALSSSFTTTSSYSNTSTSASFALSASYAPSTPPFPYTGSAEITGSLTISGSFSVQGALIPGFPPFIPNIGPHNAIKVDDINSQRILYGSPNLGASASIDFGNRSLSDANGYSALNWEGQAGTYNTYLYNQQSINATTRGNLISFSNLSGQVLMESYFDLAVVNDDLVYLNTDGQWYQVDQTTDSSTKMLGIAKSIYLQTGSVLIEGDLVVSTSPGYPNVQGANYGLPVYIRNSSGTSMSTTVPNTGYVRLLGHCYYTPYAGATEWIMKFRPSNEWIEL